MAALIVYHRVVPVAVIAMDHNSHLFAGPDTGGLAVVLAFEFSHDVGPVLLMIKMCRVVLQMLLQRTFTAKDLAAWCARR